MRNRGRVRLRGHLEHDHSLSTRLDEHETQARARPDAYGRARLGGYVQAKEKARVQLGESPRALFELEMHLAMDHEMEGPAGAARTPPRHKQRQLVKRARR